MFFCLSHAWTPCSAACHHVSHLEMLSMKWSPCQARFHQSPLGLVAWARLEFIKEKSSYASCYIWQLFDPTKEKCSNLIFCQKQVIVIFLKLKSCFIITGNMTFILCCHRKKKKKKLQYKVLFFLRFILSSFCLFIFYYIIDNLYILPISPVTLISMLYVSWPTMFFTTMV